jgi:hypothetical protein
MARNPFSRSYAQSASRPMRERPQQKSPQALPLFCETEQSGSFASPNSTLTISYSLLIIDSRSNWKRF